MTELDKAIFLIADALRAEPHPAITYAARYLIAEYDRSKLPDWIEALANANTDIWDEAVDEIRLLKKSEEMDNDSNDINK